MTCGSACGMGIGCTARRISSLTTSVTAATLACGVSKWNAPVLPAQYSVQKNISCISVKSLLSAPLVCSKLSVYIEVGVKLVFLFPPPTRCFRNGNLAFFFFAINLLFCSETYSYCKWWLQWASCRAAIIGCHVSLISGAMPSTVPPCPALPLLCPCC